MTWKKPCTVLGASPRSISAPSRRLTSAEVRPSSVAGPPSCCRYHSIFCWYHSMVCGLRFMTLSSASHSRTNAAMLGDLVGLTPMGRTALTGRRATTVPSSGRASSTSTLFRIRGRPPRLPLRARRDGSGSGSSDRNSLATVFEKPNGFHGFFGLIGASLQLVWSPASRSLKTRKPGPKDRVSNTSYTSEAFPKRGSCWWAGRESNPQSFRGGFTDRWARHVPFADPVRQTRRRGLV